MPLIFPTIAATVFRTTTPSPSPTMWFPALLRPLRAVAFDTLLALARGLPVARLLESNNRPADGIPVFVMMPLDFACDNPRISTTEIDDALSKLAQIGVHGVMVDVWWGLCEPEPRKYDFELYAKLADTCKRLGLKMQATMCFHACGGNVGDSVDIPLPRWVETAADKHDAWFRDREQAISRSAAVNREYLSFGTDHHEFLPDICKPVKKSVQESTVKVKEGELEKPKQSEMKVVDESTVAGVNNGGEVIGAEPERDAEIIPGSQASTATDTVGRDLSGNDAQPAKMRTPMEAYADFIEAFWKYMSSNGNDYLESVITELQIGLGPCGELRYPSYPMSADKWKFPGIGEFQAYDPHILDELKIAAHEVSISGLSSEARAKWNVPPNGAGSYNDTPFATTFFTRGFKTEYGKFFQKWYSQILLRHCDNMLTNVRKIVRPDETSVALAVKISGIHWWHFTASRAAEATAGYYVSKEYNFYVEAAKLFKKHSAVFDFTCLEMKTIRQPFLKARCGPRQLVGEVFRTAAKENIAVAGENALERYDREAYAQVVRAFKWTNALSHGFTLLRLTRALLEEDHLKNLERLVKDLRAIKQRHARGQAA